MNYETILFTTNQNIATITLNRPDVYNAANEKLTTEIQDVLKTIEHDSDIRAIIITGAGKAFCSGQDLKDTQGQTRSLRDSLNRRYNPIIKKIRTIEKPFIAAVNGVAAGAGCSLALACDLRVMASSAYMNMAFVKIGLVPDSGAHFFLMKLAGMGRAFEMAALGEKIQSETCLQWGLTNWVVPDSDLSDKANNIALQLAQSPTKAIGMIKRTFNQASHQSLEFILDYEGYMQEAAGKTEDFKEGVTSFAEKRKPIFKGK